MKSKKVICYKEWLPLNKNEFAILAVIAERNGFEGNLTELCRRLSLNPQTNTKNRLKTAIETLTKNGFCECTKIGQKYCMKIIPQAQAINIFPEAIRDLINHKSTIRSVAWEQVLKVYLWICQHNWDEITTNAIIATECGTSESTVSNAKRILKEEFHGIIVEKETKRLEDGEYRTIGHHICASAWWSGKCNNIK